MWGNKLSWPLPVRSQCAKCLWIRPCFRNIPQLMWSVLSSLAFSMHKETSVRFGFFSIGFLHISSCTSAFFPDQRRSSSYFNSKFQHKNADISGTAGRPEGKDTRQNTSILYLMNECWVRSQKFVKPSLHVHLLRSVWVKSMKFPLLRACTYATRHVCIGWVPLKLRFKAK